MTPGLICCGLPLPLTAVQILYVNLATDGLPALAVDPHEKVLMRRNPRTGIFTRPVGTLMTVGGLWSALVNISLFARAMSSGRSIKEAMTMTFVSLALIQFFKAHNESNRSDLMSQIFLKEMETAHSLPTPRRRPSSSPPTGPSDAELTRYAVEKGLA